MYVALAALLVPSCIEEGGCQEIIEITKSRTHGAEGRECAKRGDLQLPGVESLVELESKV